MIVALVSALAFASCAPAARAERPSVATAQAAPALVATNALRLPASAPAAVASASPASTALAPASSSATPNSEVPEPRQRCGTPNPDPRRAICAPGARGDQCAECPAFSSFAGQAGGDVRVYAYGSFSGPYNETLVALSGCGPHSENYGGTAPVRAVEGGFVPISYVPGFLPDQCEKVAISGIDRLACREGYGSNGGTYMSMAAVADFKSRRIDWLLYSQCESGVDIGQVKWIAKKTLLRLGGDQNGALDPEVRKATAASPRVPKEWLPSPSEYEFVELCDPAD